MLVYVLRFTLYTHRRRIHRAGVGRTNGQKVNRGFTIADGLHSLSRTRGITGRNNTRYNANANPVLAISPVVGFSQQVESLVSTVKQVFGLEGQQEVAEFVNAEISFLNIFPKRVQYM